MSVASAITMQTVGISYVFRSSTTPVAEGAEAQLVCQLRAIHGVGQILLVREHEQHWGSCKRLASFMDNVRKLGVVFV